MRGDLLGLGAAALLALAGKAGAKSSGSPHGSSARADKRKQARDKAKILRASRLPDLDYVTIVRGSVFHRDWIPGMVIGASASGRPVVSLESLEPHFGIWLAAEPYQESARKRGRSGPGTTFRLKRDAKLLDLEPFWNDDEDEGDLLLHEVFRALTGKKFDGTEDQLANALEQALFKRGFDGMWDPGLFDRRAEVLFIDIPKLFSVTYHQSEVPDYN